MIDVVEILQHWHAGRPKLVLSASLGVDPKTVRKYVALWGSRTRPWCLTSGFRPPSRTR